MIFPERRALLLSPRDPPEEGSSFRARAPPLALALDGQPLQDDLRAEGRLSGTLPCLPGQGLPMLGHRTGIAR
jgi:hypothetical protein